jgi:hypothetical protein
MLTSCAARYRHTRSESLTFRQELEESSGECRRISTGRVMNEIGKADLLSSRHAFANAFIDQLIVGMRFLAMRDQCGPGEGPQCIAGDGRRGRTSEQQRGGSRVVEKHLLRCLWQAVKTTRLKLIDALQMHVDAPGSCDGSGRTLTAGSNGGGNCAGALFWAAGVI